MTTQTANPASPISKVPLEALREPFYEGSVQRLYAIPDQPDYMVTETSAGGSVFDVGTIFSIEGSDVARAVFRHVLYSGLAKSETWQEVKAAVEVAHLCLDIAVGADVRGIITTQVVAKTCGSILPLGVVKFRSGPSVHWSTGNEPFCGCSFSNNYCCCSTARWGY